jgi:signal peptidase I
MRRGVWRPIAAVLVLVLAWDLIAPVQLGGRVSYVNVRGISMEPTLVTGDLLVMRRQAAYDVGQIVAFETDMSGAIVVHRVVDVVGERYLLKGDNNAFIDRFTPTADEIVGAEALTIPGGERIATLAASTPTIALQASMLLATLWVLRSSHIASRKERVQARRRRAVTPGRTSSAAPPVQPSVTSDPQP